MITALQKSRIETIKRLDAARELLTTPLSPSCLNDECNLKLDHAVELIDQVLWALVPNAPVKGSRS